MVIGRIGNWSMPFILTLTQAATILIAWLALYKTGGLWGGLVGSWSAPVLYLSVGAVAAMVSGRSSVEGRTVPRAALGYLALLCSPRPPSYVTSRWSAFECVVLVTTPRGEGRQ